MGFLLDIAQLRTQSPASCVTLLDIGQLPDAVVSEVSCCVVGQSHEAML